MISALLFDLDNTLYPERSGMEDGIVRYMNEFIAGVLGVSLEESVRQRREGVRNYGTSLEWLMKEKGFDDFDAYFRAIHPEGEEECIEFDPELPGILDALPWPKAILTNSPREHAVRVLEKLKVADRFSAIYDIRFNDLVGKPAASAFTKTLDDFGYRVEEVVFVDDLPKYAVGFRELGGRVILMDEYGRHSALGYESVAHLRELPALLAAPFLNPAPATRAASVAR